MTISLTLDKELEDDIRRRWLAIFTAEDLNLTPEQVFDDVNFLIFQLDRFQRAYGNLEAQAERDDEESHPVCDAQIESLQAEVERVTKDRDELSGTIENCHEMLDKIDPDYEEGTTSLDPLDTRLKNYLFDERRITDDMVNGDD